MPIIILFVTGVFLSGCMEAASDVSEQVAALTEDQLEWVRRCGIHIEHSRATWAVESCIARAHILYPDSKKKTK